MLWSKANTILWMFSETLESEIAENESLLPLSSLFQFYTIATPHCQNKQNPKPTDLMTQICHLFEIKFDCGNTQNLTCHLENRML